MYCVSTVLGFGCNLSQAGVGITPGSSHWDCNIEYVEAAVRFKGPPPGLGKECTASDSQAKDWLTDC